MKNDFIKEYKNRFKHPKVEPIVTKVPRRGAAGWKYTSNEKFKLKNIKN